MATRYWVGGTGNWDASDTTHWSASSGGAGGESVPTSADDVIFDTSSSTSNAAYTCTIADVAACADLTMAGPGAGNNITWAGSSALSIYGSLNLSGGSTDITNSYTGAITFAATTTGHTVTLNGVELFCFGAALTFDGVGGGWTLQDTLTVTSGGGMTLTNGSLDTANNAVNVATFTSNNANVRALTLGTTTMTLTGAAGWNTTDSTNFTLSAASSTLSLIASGNTSFLHSGSTFGTINITTSGAGRAVSLAFPDFSCTNFIITGNPQLTHVLTADTGTITVTVSGSFEINGTSQTSRAALLSGRPSRLTINAATVSLSNVDLVGIAGAGAATWTGTSIGNGGNCSGITFTTPVTRYWVGNGGNWNDTAHWSDSPGGSSGATTPIAHDTVIFDANSITSSSQTITVTTAVWHLGTDLDFSAVANTPALSILNLGQRKITKNSLTLGTMTQTTNSGVFEIQMISADGDDSVLTTNGVVMTSPPMFIVIGSSGGSWSLADDLVTTGTGTSGLGIRNGTFNTNNNSITAPSWTVGLVAPLGYEATFNMGTATHVFNGAPTGWNVWITSATNVTINPSSSVIKFTNNSTTQKTFAGEGLTYGDVWIATAGTGVFNITGDNTFADLEIDAGREVRFAAGSTQTLTTLTALGTEGSEIILTSDITSTHTLSAESGIISVDYCTISYSIATGGATWNAFTHDGNVDDGNNTGWNFFEAAVKTFSESLLFVESKQTVSDTELDVLSTASFFEDIALTSEYLRDDSATVQLLEESSMNSTYSRLFVELASVSETIKKLQSLMFSENVSTSSATVIDIDKAMNDSQRYTESRRNSVLSTISSALSFSEESFSTSEYLRERLESLNISHATILLALEHNRAFAENIDISEENIKSYFKSVLNTLQIVEQTLVRFVYSKILLEFETFSEDHSVTIDTARTEMLSLIDNLKKLIARQDTSTLEFAESSAGDAVTTQSLIDSLSILEIRLSDISLTKSELTDISEITGRSQELSFSEIASIAAQSDNSIGKSFSSEMALTESLVRHGIAALHEILLLFEEKFSSSSTNMLSQLVLSENFDKEYIATREFSEALALVEVVKKTVSLSFTETALLIEVAANVFEFNRRSTDVFSVSDTLSKTSEFEYAFTETVAIVEMLSIRFSFSFTDILEILESVNVQAFTVYTLSEDEIIQFSDSISKRISKENSEVVALLEFVKSGVDRAESETLSLFEGMLKEIGKTMASSEFTLTSQILESSDKRFAIQSPIQITENVVKSSALRVSSSIVFSESFRKIAALQNVSSLSLLDSRSLTELLRKTESVEISETYLTTTNHEKMIDDMISIAEAVLKSISFAQSDVLVISENDVFSDNLRFTEQFTFQESTDTPRVYVVDIVDSEEFDELLMTLSAADRSILDNVIFSEGMLRNHSSSYKSKTFLNSTVNRPLLTSQKSKVAIFYKNR